MTDRCSRCPEREDRERLSMKSATTESRSAQEAILADPLLDFGDSGDICLTCFMNIEFIRRRAAWKTTP
jgi:hypothetical protein